MVKQTGIKKLKIQGQADIPLNQTGRMQAEIAAKYLDGIQFDAVFSSPLLRARETAKIIIKDRKIPFYIDDRLKKFLMEFVKDSHCGLYMLSPF